MTRGNAHQYLKKVYLTTKNDSYREALSIALSALRPITHEQAEKMRGEWVQVAYELAHLKCSECNHSINRFYGVSEFCPSCGAPMTDKAVDILWARLEAMRDEN